MAILDNLSAHWKLNEASGERADSHTNNHPLTDSNSNIGSATGKIGDGADFTNTVTKLLYIISHADFDLNGDYCIALWMYPKSNPEVELSVFGKWDGTGVVCYLRPDGGLHINNGVTTITTSAGFITLNAWNFLIVQYDSSSVGSELQAINNNGTPETVTSTPSSNNSLWFCVGGDILLDPSTNTNTASDAIFDSVSFWKRALTSAEIELLWNSGNGMDYPFDGSGGGGDDVYLPSNNTKIPSIATRRRTNWYLTT